MLLKENVVSKIKSKYSINSSKSNKSMNNKFMEEIICIKAEKINNKGLFERWKVIIWYTNNFE